MTNIVGCRAALLLILGLGACGPSAQQRYARSILPAELELESGAGAGGGNSAPMVRSVAGRAFRLRVHASTDYRVQVADWQRRFRGLVGRINQLIAGPYGVRLEVVDFRNWNRSTSGDSMETLLAELRKSDAGEDVDWVVGLINAEEVMSGSLHTLGMAYPLGRHFVLRNLSDIAEYQSLARVLDELSRSERDELLSRRKQHKELVTFLHEWGHTLGAMHIYQDRSLMNPTYNDHQIDFSVANARLLDISLRHRRDAGRVATWEGEARAELRAYLEETDDPDWDRASHAEMARLVGVPARAGAGAGAGEDTQTQAAATSGGATGASSEDADYATLAAAAAEARAGHYLAAFAAFDSLLSRRPGDAQLHLMACQSGARAEVAMDRLKAICDRAAGLAPHDPVALLFLAEALLLRHDGAAARDVMRSVESRLDDKPASSTYWSTLAGLYERASSPTRADAAEAHAHHDSRSGIPPRTLRLATLRRMFGLPAATASGALPIDGEADYIETATSIRTLEQSGHRDEAATDLARFTEKYPSLPGATILACEHEGRGGAPKARLRCQRAIAQRPDAVLALYVLASLDEQAGKTGPAIARLVHLIEVDPSLAEVWLLLGRLYRKTHQVGKLAELRAWYQDRFKAQMP